MAKKSIDENIVQGKTKSGIQFTLNKRMTKMQDDDNDLAEKGKAVVGILKLIFGTDEGVISFMDAVASVNDGVCDTEKMLAELMEMFEALAVKNS